MSNTSTTTPAAAKSSAYENNPFFVATNGLDLLFKRAQTIGILLAILVGISALSSLPSAFLPSNDQRQQTPAAQGSDATGFPSIPAEVWLIIVGVALLLVLVFSFVGIVIRGLLDYTAANLAKDKQTTISEAFRGVFGNFWGYTWVLVIASVKTFLWTLLFIIPGIVMSVRYSLAGVAYFDKKLKGNESVKHSSALVKGAWLTTNASQNLLNIITLGIIQPLLVPGTNGILYRQLSAAGETKPKAHVLSWLTLIIPLILGALVLVGIFFLVWALVNYSNAA